MKEWCEEKTKEVQGAYKKSLEASVPLWLEEYIRTDKEDKWIDPLSYLSDETSESKHETDKDQVNNIELLL